MSSDRHPPDSSSYPPAAAGDQPEADAATTTPEPDAAVTPPILGAEVLSASDIDWDEYEPL